MQKKPIKNIDRLMATKKPRRSIDPATRQLIVQIIGGIGIFIVIALLITGIWYGSRVSALTLETVTIEGGQTISHTEVHEAVADALAGNYFGLIPKRFALLYPQEAAVAAAGKVARVKNPVVERVSGTELRVVVDEYIPFALWCSEKETADCYFVDSEGIVFAKAPVLDGGAMYRFYTLGIDPEVKKKLREGPVLNEIVALAEGLEERFQFPITKIELDTVGDIFFKVVGGGEIKTTINQSSKKTLENLALVLSTDDFKNLKAGKFQYIDLRFGNKVFVNDIMPESATSTSSVRNIIVNEAIENETIENDFELAAEEETEVLE